MSSNFSESTKWALVNDYTFRTPIPRSDKLATIKCLPAQIDVELKDLELEYQVNWGSWNSWEDKHRTFGHRSNVRIRARGQIVTGRVTAFRPSTGSVKQFTKIKTVTLSPIEETERRGRYTDIEEMVLHYDRRDAAEVPSEGLMHNEPGELRYSRLDFFSVGEEEDREVLLADLYIDEGPFNDLVEALKSGHAHISTARATILAELFRVDPDETEPDFWIRDEYGLLDQGDYGITRARLEGLTLTWTAINRGSGPKFYEQDNASIAENGELSPPEKMVLRIVRELRRIALSQRILIAVVFFGLAILAGKTWG